MFLVADEDGADICEWRFNIKEESLQKNKKMEQGEGGGGQQPWRGIETPTGVLEFFFLIFENGPPLYPKIVLYSLFLENSFDIYSRYD